MIARKCVCVNIFVPVKSLETLLENNTEKDKEFLKYYYNLK